MRRGRRVRALPVRRSPEGEGGRDFKKVAHHFSGGCAFFLRVRPGGMIEIPTRNRRPLGFAPSLAQRRGLVSYLPGLIRFDHKNADL
jgi:hypothetical protein